LAHQQAAGTLAPLSDTPAFAQAFGGKPGDATVAAEPIAVW
jgi:hypothetical protein